MALMTRQAFIDYAHQALSVESLEALHERCDEHNGEVARFGDSWPGAMIELHRSADEVFRIERQLARLEGRAPREFRFRICSPR
jgi:hypothetical protein